MWIKIIVLEAVFSEVPCTNRSSVRVESFVFSVYLGHSSCAPPFFGRLWNVRLLLRFMLVVQPTMQQCVAPPMLNRQHTMAVDSESGSVCADVQCSVCVLKARKRKGMLANQHIAISQPLGTAGGAQASRGALSYTGFTWNRHGKMGQ